MQGSTPWKEFAWDLSCSECLPKHSACHRMLLKICGFPHFLGWLDCTSVSSNSIAHSTETNWIPGVSYNGDETISLILVFPLPKDQTLGNFRTLLLHSVQCAMGLHREEWLVLNPVDDVQWRGQLSSEINGSFQAPDIKRDSRPHL